MEHIILKLLQFQNQMKIYHFQTNLYSRHVAADKLVENRSTKLDLIAEILQFQHPIKLKKNSVIKLQNLNDEDIVEYLNGMVTWLNTKFLKKVTNKPEILTVRDELLGDVKQTLYLFNLK